VPSRLLLLGHLGLVLRLLRYIVALADDLPAEVDEDLVDVRYTR
jgi:hypothetical protein